MDGPRSAVLRAGRRSEAGAYFVVTFCCQGRRPWLADINAARIVVGTLREQADRGLAETFAFVVMPDHVHWLLKLSGARPLSSVVGWVKRSAAHRIRLKSQLPGRKIWQAGFYDHRIRDDFDLYFQGTYILNNPIRGGLVTDLGTFPHWDAPGWI
jgi:REP-associated tyrosine transposase